MGREVRSELGMGKWRLVFCNLRLVCVLEELRRLIKEDIIEI
jgi:hypothetical protein